MAKKRKLEAEPSQNNEDDKIVSGDKEEEEEIGYEEEEEEEEEEYEVEVEEEEEEEEYEMEVVEEYEVEVVEEEEAEEDDPHSNVSVGEETMLVTTILSNNDRGGEEAIESNINGDEVEEEEPIQSVLAAFSKDTLVELLTEAAEGHADVAARVRASADVDPSNRKIFVHGLKWDTTTETLLVKLRTGRAARQALKEPHKLIDERMTASQLARVYTEEDFCEGGLDPEKVKNFFSMYGEIETGKPKGFCLFIYKTVESAKLALSEPHKQFEGVTPHKSVAKTQNYMGNVSSSSTMVPPCMQ